MAFVTAVTDVQDQSGASIVTPNADGTRPPLVVRIGPGITATYTKSGDLGIVLMQLTGGTTPNLGDGFSLGSQSPPQYVAAVSLTAQVTTGGGNVLVGTVQVPPNAVVTFDLSVNAKIILPTPGILLPGALDLFCMCSNYGTSGAKVLGNPSTDSGRSTASSPWIPTSVTLTGSGSTVQIYAVPYSPPAFVSTHAYTGGLAASTTLPNGIGDTTNSMVTNDSGKLYVCTSGGTDSGSAGPTGSGAGAISVGGLTWYYVGTAAAGVTSRITVTLNGIRTG